MLPAPLQAAATAAVALLLCQPAVPADPVAAVPATAAASAPAAPVPQAMIDQIESHFAPTEQPSSREEAVKILTDHLNQALGIGRQVEAEHPDAPNLYVVRNQMLSAALQLAALAPTQDNQDQVMQIAERIVGSPAPPEEKLQADFMLTRQKIMSEPGVSAPAAQEKEKQIQTFLNRYKDSPAAAKSLAYGVLLASAGGLSELKVSLLDELEKGYADQEDIMPFLLHYGRGKFSARLKRLDGTELAVPGDVKAKVIVVDFWATWCGPCVAEVPETKQIYDKFHPQGVEFVGVSLDQDPGAIETVEKFVKENGTGWVQTVSGLGWLDPTARKYGVDAIPSIWVIDPAGKIISSHARGNLEQVLTQALGKQPATAPAAAMTEPAR